MNTHRDIVRDILRRAGHRPQKSLGQNFLIDPAIHAAIAACAALTPNTLVVEVGPGLGFLTRELVARAGRVIAVEIDQQLLAFLRVEFSNAKNLELIEADIRHFEPPAEPYVIVANLPYYLSSFFLRRFLGGSVRRPERLLVLLQKEVAEKLTGPDSSVLKLSVAAYAEAATVLDIPPEAFEPPPKVHSALVELHVASAPRIASPEKPFFSVVKMAFHASRKMLSTSLRGQGLDRAVLLAAFEEAGVLPTARPETLTLEQFDRLTLAILARKA